MSEASKIWIALPDKLLAQLDAVAAGCGMSRDDALRRAVEVYVGRSMRAGLTEEMARGYQEMGSLNLALAADGDAALADWRELWETKPEGRSHGGA